MSTNSGCCCCFCRSTKLKEHYNDHDDEPAGTSTFDTHISSDAEAGTQGPLQIVRTASLRQTLYSAPKHPEKPRPVNLKPLHPSAWIPKLPTNLGTTSCIYIYIYTYILGVQVPKKQEPPTPPCRPRKSETSDAKLQIDLAAHPSQSWAATPGLKCHVMRP